MPAEKKEEALLEAFKNPELYKGIIKEHNDEILTVNGLSITLFRNFKVSESASFLAAKIFIENAKTLSLLSDENLFSIDAKVAIVETVEEISEKPEESNNKGSKDEDAEVFYLPPSNNNKANGNQHEQKKYDFPPIPVFVDDDGLVAEVYLPKGYNKAHILRIIKVLTAQVE